MSTAQVVVQLSAFDVLYRGVVYWATDVGVVSIFTHPICYRPRCSIMYISREMTHVSLFMSCVTLSRFPRIAGLSSICAYPSYEYLYKHYYFLHIFFKPSVKIPPA